MRRLDLIPVGLVLVLGGSVGAMAFRSARLAPPEVVADAPSEEVAEPADSGPVTDIAFTVGDEAGHVRSELRRSALPAPDFDRDDVLRRLSFGASGTYIVAMLEADSGLARWPERPLEPIRVWIEPTSTVDGWQPAYVDSARRAFDRWRGAGIPVRVNFLVDSTDAEVRVRWAHHLDASRIGSTRRIRDQHWWLVGGEITLAMHATSGERLPPATIGATALHETGHLFGLNHSPDAADLMATHHHGVNAPSSADLATMRLLYSVPPGRLR